MVAHNRPQIAERGLPPPGQRVAPKRSARDEAYWVAIFLFNRCASERVDGTVNLERCPSGRCGCSSKVFRETRSDFEPNHVLKACGTKAKKRHIFKKIMVCWLQGHKTICLKIYMFLHWYPKPSNKHVAKYNFKLRLSLQIVVRAPRRCTERCYPVCFIVRAPFRSTCSPFRSAHDKALRVFFCFDLLRTQESQVGKPSQRSIKLGISETTFPGII